MSTPREIYCHELDLADFQKMADKLATLRQQLDYLDRAWQRVFEICPAGPSDSHPEHVNHVVHSLKDLAEIRELAVLIGPAKFHGHWTPSEEQREAELKFRRLVGLELPTVAFMLNPARRSDLQVGIASILTNKEDHMIARLQMSDLHLGDPRSVLGDPEVVRTVTEDLAHLSGGHVGKLILAGDVWEESVPGNLAVLENGIAKSVGDASMLFFKSLYSKVKVDEIVVVSGNHDVCTWHWYQEERSQPTVTGCEGVSVDPLAWPWFTLLGGFVGKLTFAYPLYWDRSAGDDYPALFVTHGHLLDPLVLGDDSIVEYQALAALGVGRPMLKSMEDADSVSEIARGTLDFCLGLWKRYSTRDYIYANYVMRRLEHPQSCLLQKSSMGLIDEAAIHADDPVPQQGNFANVPRFLDLIIRDPNLPTPVGSFGAGPVGPAFSKPSCLTFGHDHRGTFQKVVACGVPFVAADSGGWTSEWEGHLPHTHVLVWSKVEDVVPSAYLMHFRGDLVRRKLSSSAAWAFEGGTEKSAKTAL